jgi:hypothetical protein
MMEVFNGVMPGSSMAVCNLLSGLTDVDVDPSIMAFSHFGCLEKGLV